MNRASVAILLAVVLSSCSVPPPALELNNHILLPFLPAHFDERQGIGIKSGVPCYSLLKLDINWYYNWGYDPRLPCAPDKEYVDMLFDGSQVGTPTIGGTVLGFNEFNDPQQANMSIGEVVDAWREVESLYADKTLVSPVSTSGVFYIIDVMRLYRTRYGVNPRFDAVAVHYYPQWSGGYSLSGYITEMRTRLLAEGMDVPIWLTEFGTCGPDEASAIAFMQDSKEWLAQQSYIARWAWYAAHVPDEECWGPYDLIDADGTLTLLGVIYSGAQLQ